jgi:hypothetical protein
MKSFRYTKNMRIMRQKLPDPNYDNNNKLINNNNIIINNNIEIIIKRIFIKYYSFNYKN